MHRDGDAAACNDRDPPTPFDRLLRAGLARYTLGLSPAALGLAYADWAIHLAASPGKRAELAEKGFRKFIRFVAYAASSAGRPDAEACIAPLPQDRRFDSELWRQPPFNLFHQAFLLQQQWWHSATTGVSGVSAHHEQLTTFMARQALDTMSPVNFVPTNPEVLAATFAEGGLNLARGALNFWQDWERALGEKPPLGAERFRPGKEVAVTPGEVIFRNHLIELIQYAPVNAKVAAEPVLIAPAWIMKYYILDLSPQNSLVKYLVDHGHTVFMISWRNPGAEDRDIGMDDYLRLGLLEALKAVNAIVPDAPVNAVGYCLGGTLLSIAAAYLAREGLRAFNTITLLAAQTDFTEAGELSLLIDESQLSFLEDIMWNQGFLDARQMAGTFQLLRSGDLIWSRMVHEYLMGQRPPMSDLMAWNADATRMPYRMHSEYLRRLFLDNDLFEGRYPVDGRPVSLGDIQAPVFVVATESDHVAPWRSVYKIHLIESIDITFVLTSGGHNAGIVSEPGHHGRRLRVGRRAAHTRFSGPDEWLARAEVAQGSWWPRWLEWLEGRSRGQVAAPGLGCPDRGYAPLAPAPGTYVLQA
ncbi:alpha/beta fold hydrolase [Rhodoblastus acidophilus]|uniref:Alpha/beta fold hydrolase n=1 Tax=Rhodoblastus acidophilus TaxID=1074 RepID=A0A6N8DKQ5_RHOAC|nr:alpha/beta fold hydrolase [Rhodoblastus acidophilus]